MYQFNTDIKIIDGQEYVQIFGRRRESIKDEINRLLPIMKIGEIKILDEKNAFEKTETGFNFFVKKARTL